ncbi:F0F1 ATP synthase subunit gamma, partial [Escherichia coli]|nr:F0F1 ATP synthase subunit gamma [Escherichia coli]
LGKLGFADARGYADDLIARFEAGEFDVATLFYSTFKSVLAQEPTAQQIIPVAVPAAAAEAPGSGAAVTYEPDEESILADLL